MSALWGRHARVSECCELRALLPRFHEISVRGAFQKNMKWSWCVLLFSCTGTATVHGTFDRHASLLMCRRWTEDAARARLALEHPSAFAVASVEYDRLALFVIRPVGRHIHRVDAVASDGGSTTLARRFRALRKWHQTRFAQHVLIASHSLPHGEARAWDDA
jgi:hypothetical protein